MDARFHRVPRDFAQRDQRAAYPCTTPECTGAFENVPGAQFIADKVDGGVHWRIPFHCKTCGEDEDSVGFWRPAGKAKKDYTDLADWPHDAGTTVELVKMKADNPTKADKAKKAKTNNVKEKNTPLAAMIAASSRAKAPPLVNTK